jgi:thiamine transporter
MKGNNIKIISEGAIMVALATVLSLLKIDLPFGGGVTIVSMLPLVVFAHRHGTKWGLFTAFVYSVLQLILGLDNVSYATNAVTAAGIILFDYIVAYTVIGLSAVFGSTRKGVALGICCSFFLRFVCHLITGALIWGQWMPEEFMGMPMTNPWIYSCLYNGWYMLAETVLTLIVAMVLYETLKKNFFAK